MQSSRLFTVMAFTLLSACSNPVGMQKSGIETPVTWNTTSSFPLEGPLVVDDSAEVEQKWWQSFGDQILDIIIFEAIENNKTLAIATTRIAEARAARLGAFAVLLPQVTIQVTLYAAIRAFTPMVKCYLSMILPCKPLGK